MEEAIRSLSKANNHFALTLHKSFASEEGNIFFSPFSISTALAMLFNGARGDTAKEMRRVLGYDTANLSDDQVHRGFENLLTTMNDNPDVYSLAIANALLTQKDFPFLSRYKEDLKRIYRAVTREVNFTEEGPKVVAEINEWVKENTRNMIPKLFDSLDPSTIMVLLNAVYFKGMWEIPFNPKFTKLKAFYNYGLESGIKNVPMMYVARNFGFLETTNFKALELPYKGEHIVMLLLLPTERDGLKELQENLTLEFISDLRQITVEVTVPKFHLEYKKTLNEVLEELGLKSLFSNRANLKGLSPSEGISVSKVLHKALVDVNEEGTEAAAATCTRVKRSAATSDFVFEANHPFLFLVVDKRCANIILFMGRVEEL